MHTEKIEYYDGDLLLEGYLAHDGNISESKPAVLIAHDWKGCGEFVYEKARQLAALGYVAFASDMYGKNKISAHATREEKLQHMLPLKENRPLLRQRIQKGFDVIKNLAYVDTTRIAGMGYCFGGLCVLDLARTGADIQGVVSFHGTLDVPANLPSASVIKSKVLVLHGHEDPMVPPEQVADFEEEMTKSKVDWQIHIYGHAKHSFTNPEANDPTLGMLYEKHADKRSWVAMLNFLSEVFA